MTSPGQCTDDVCITCGDVAVEVVVVQLMDAGLAMVDTGSGSEEISVALVDAAVGDLLLVHAGEAIANVSAATIGQEPPR